MIHWDAMPITCRCTRLLLFGYGSISVAYLSSGLLTVRLLIRCLSSTTAHRWYKCRTTANPDRCSDRGSIIDCNRIGRHQNIAPRSGNACLMQQQIWEYVSQGHINASKLSKLQIIEHTLNSFFFVRIPVQTFETMVFRRPRRRTEQPSALPISWDNWTCPISHSMKLRYTGILV